MNKKDSQEVEIAPLRALDDFLLDSARFQVPNVKDLEKWGNRVASNLLYYQTNYFLLAAGIITIVGVLHPIRMISGCITTGLIIGVFLFITSRTSTNQIYRRHPRISVLIMLGSLYLIAHMFQSILVFFLGILLPFSVIFLHASLRLRNIKNKLVNKVEVLGLKKTPMGLFLAEMGLESEPF